MLVGGFFSLLCSQSSQQSVSSHSDSTKYVEMKGEGQAMVTTFLRDIIRILSVLIQLYILYSTLACLAYDGPKYFLTPTGKLTWNGNRSKIFTKAEGSLPTRTRATGSHSKMQKFVTWRGDEKDEQLYRSKVKRSVKLHLIFNSYKILKYVSQISNRTVLITQLCHFVCLHF